MNAPMLLSPEALAKIDKAVAKYPPEEKQSAVMAALTIAQDRERLAVHRDHGFRGALSGDAAGRGV